jgi:hypothetical protein
LNAGHYGMETLVEYTMKPSSGAPWIRVPPDRRQQPGSAHV